MTSQPSSSQAARSSPRISARVSTFSAGAGSALRCSRRRRHPLRREAHKPSETEGEPCRISRGRARCEPISASSVASHPLLGEVDLPYPAGATRCSHAGSRFVRSAKSGGRSMIRRRRRTRASWTVGVVATPCLLSPESAFDTNTSRRRGHPRPSRRWVPPLSMGSRPQARSGAPSNGSSPVSRRNAIGIWRRAARAASVEARRNAPWPSWEIRAARRPPRSSTRLLSVRRPHVAAA